MPRAISQTGIARERMGGEGEVKEGEWQRKMLDIMQIQ